MGRLDKLIAGIDKVLAECAVAPAAPGVPGPRVPGVWRTDDAIIFDPAALGITLNADGTVAGIDLEDSPVGRALRDG
jgi:hypothetical protein